MSLAGGASGWTARPAAAFQAQPDIRAAGEGERNGGSGSEGDGEVESSCGARSLFLLALCPLRWADSGSATQTGRQTKC